MMKPKDIKTQFLHPEKRGSSPFGEPLNFFDVATSEILDENNHINFPADNWLSITASQLIEQANALINQLPNANLLCIKQRNYLRNLLMSGKPNFGGDLRDHVSISNDGDFYLIDQMHFVQDEFQELFNDEALAVPPHCLMGHAPRFYTTETDEPILLAGFGKIAPNSDDSTFVVSLKDLKANTNYQGLSQWGRTRSLFQQAADDILNGLLFWDEKNKKWTRKEKATNKFPKTKKKADYKNKAYKNTAKQTKPSLILMSLIKKV